MTDIGKDVGASRISERARIGTTDRPTAGHVVTRQRIVRRHITTATDRPCNTARA